MGFKANHKEATQGSSIKPEGDYECIILKIEEKETNKSKKKYLNCTLIVRNDVEQGYKNAYIWHTLWKRREPTPSDMQVNGYSFGQVMAIGQSAGLPDGKEYDSLEEFCKDLINKPVRVTIKHEEYNGNIQERVNYVNPTKYPDCKHVFRQKPETTETGYATKPQQFANPSATQQQFADILDDDLPF